MTTWGPQFWTTVTRQIHFQSRMEWNRTMSSSLLSSAWCSLSCYTMLHNDDGIQLRYRIDGGVFNLRRLKANTKVKVASMRELLYAENCSLNSNSEAEMQQCVDYFSVACNNFFYHPSAPRRQKSCASLHRGRCITSHTSSWMTSHLKLPIRSPTWEATSPGKPTLTHNSITDIPKPTLHLEDPGRKCGNDEESAKTPS